MTSQLEVVFGELGISHYLHTFVDQGFDTWGTILDITESDLDALGVKLGHRRKLQRRIANSRGVAPEAALVSPTRQSIEEPRPDGLKLETSKVEGPPTSAVKRKYRRHPKPDDDAPERPPSAYVLFSNKMREDLKDRNLTFTEIAKLVGDNWQNLSPAEKEPFETQAQKAKDKFTRELSEYKKTAEYRKYTVYLADFKAKHASQTHDKDASKRVKLTGSGGGSPSSASTPRRGRSSTHSGSEDSHGRDSLLPRKHRGSSATETTSGLMDTNVTDVRHKESSSTQLAEYQQVWSDGQQREDMAANGRRALPRFSDVFDDGSSVVGAMIQHSQRAGSTATTPGSIMATPGLVGGHFRPASLTKQYSSTESTTSTVSWPRTPQDNPLPIHALLSGKPGQQIYELPTPTAANPLSHSFLGKTTAHLNPASPSYPFPSNRNGSISTSDSFFPSGHDTSGQHRPDEHHSTSPQMSLGRPGSHTTLQDGHRPGPSILNNSSSTLGNLDGISALLQARDIVDRRGQ